MADYDVVIVGSGIVGATAALLLAKKTQLRIAVIEAKEPVFSWESDTYDFRVSAVSLSSKKIFQNIQVWDSIIQKRVSPYTHMHVWDVDEQAEIKFDCADVNERELGYIIEDNVMRSSLMDEIRKQTNIDLLFSRKLINVIPAKAGIQISINFKGTTETINTKLLIAADGANSLVRDLAKIELKSWDYEHTAIVATVETDGVHQKTAQQQFLATGPLAFLPLENSNTSSIVWSTSHAHAKELLELSDNEFSLTLRDAFNNKLGDVKNISSRYSFPLRMRHAKSYVQASLALIGDAAHTVHPLAGQGVNLGLLDAACLSEVIIEAIKKNRNYFSLPTLRRYERWRKSDNLAMLAGVEVLKRLFAVDKKPMRQIRNVGLNFTNRTQFLKNFFAHYALGCRGDMPEVAK